MYVPAHFAIEDRRAIVAFIEREPFGVLVSDVSGKPFATHVPFVVLDDGESLTLGAHVARANPQWEAIDGQDVLAIFQGPHGMVSASWYAQPERSVPTWNYAAIHCSGRARLTDAAGTDRILRRIVAQFEPSWRIENAEPDYVARMQRAIAGIEITVSRIDGAFKHSQNRTAEDRARVIEELGASPKAMDRELAKAMRATLR